MNINTRDMNFVKFNNEIMNFVNYNGVEVYSAGYWLTKTGYPCVLTNSLGKTLRDYKIYGNSEQDDCEENQLNIAMTPTTLNGITSTKLDDGSYQFTGTSTASTTFRSVNIYSNRKLYKAGTYYIPDEITIDNVVLGLNFTTDSSGGTLKQIQINSNSGRTFTLDNDYYLAQWYIWFKSANTNYDFNFFPQITKEDITEHKPYVSIPTQENPSEIKSVGDYDSTTGKYKIPIKVETLNICKSNRLNTTTIYSGVTQTIDENGVITLNGTSTAVSFPSYASTKSFFLPKGTYTLCGNMTGRGIAEDGSEVVFPFHIQEDDSGNAKTLGASSTSPVRFTTTQDWNCKMYIYINKKNVTFDNVKYYPMLVKGSYTADDMPEFEPYKEPILTNVYLEEPLRKAGNYADYIDFKNQKVVRKIYEDDLINKIWTTFTNKYFTPTKIYKYENGVESLCNLLKYGGTTTSAQDSMEDDYYYLFYNSNNPNIRRFMCNLATYEKIKDLTNLKFYYVLATPTEEDIILPEIETFKGTNYIITDTTISPSNIEVVYKSSKAGD